MKNEQVTMSCRDYVLANKRGAKGCVYNLLAVYDNLLLIGNDILDSQSGRVVTLSDPENQEVAYG